MGDRKEVKGREMKEGRKEVTEGGEGRKKVKEGREEGRM